MTYWHGGPRIVGDLILPGRETGNSRSGDIGVFVTTDRSLAEIYASTVTGPAWVYEVEPLTEPVAIPSLVGGRQVSYRCEAGTDNPPLHGLERNPSGLPARGSCRWVA